MRNVFKMMLQPKSADWLTHRRLATPQKTALTFGGMAWTFAELDELTNSLCNWLGLRPLPENRRVGVLMHNRPEYVLLIYAAARMGLTLVTLNSRLTTAEVERQIRFTQCSFVIVDGPNHPTVDGIDRVKIDQVPDVSQLISQPATQQANEWATSNGQQAMGGGSAIQSIVFTSGTTGQPKAVPVTFNQLFYSAMGSAYRLGVQSDDVWLSVLPLYHVGGLAVIFRSVLYGTAVDLHSRFDLSEINRALDEKPISLISVVPTMLYRLTETRDVWPDSMRIILVGGAAASPELVEAAGKLSKDRELLVATSYGMTEVGSQFATQTPAETELKPASVGKPFLFNQLKVVNDLGEESTVGEVGEIQIKGIVVMEGYLDNPEANAQRFTADGWFCTGDLGYLDGDGDLFVVQRRSDLILSGGENVYPAEVEAALRQHPAVKEACVVGLPDPEWGQTVAAMVELLPGEQLKTQDLTLFSQEKLARYKHPRTIRFVTQLPQTASGKIERKMVFEQLSKKVN